MLLTISKKILVVEVLRNYFKSEYALKNEKRAKPEGAIESVSDHGSAPPSKSKVMYIEAGEAIPASYPMQKPLSAEQNVRK